MTAEWVFDQVIGADHWSLEGSFWKAEIWDRSQRSERTSVAFTDSRTGGLTRMQKWTSVCSLSDAKRWLESMGAHLEAQPIPSWLRDMGTYKDERTRAVWYGIRHPPSVDNFTAMFQAALISEHMVTEMLQSPKVLAAALIQLSPKDRDQIFVLYDALQEKGVGS